MAQSSAQQNVVPLQDNLANPQVATTTPTTIATTYDGNAATIVVPFVADMAADAAGTLGVIQATTVEMTNIDYIVSVAVSDANAVKLLKAFKAEDTNTGLNSTGAELQVDMVPAKASGFKAALKAAITANSITANKTMYNYIKDESYKDTLDALGFDTLADLLSASDLTAFDVELDVSGGASNMFNKMNEDDGALRKAIFTQIKEAQIEDYLNDLVGAYAGDICGAWVAEYDPSGNDISGGFDVTGVYQGDISAGVWYDGTTSIDEQPTLTLTYVGPDISGAFDICGNYKGDLSAGWINIVNLVSYVGTDVSFNAYDLDNNKLADLSEGLTYNLAQTPTTAYEGPDQDLSGHYDITRTRVPDLSAGFVYLHDGSDAPVAVYIGPDQTATNSNSQQVDISYGFVLDPSDNPVYVGFDVSGGWDYDGELLPDVSAGWSHRYPNASGVYNLIVPRSEYVGPDISGGFDICGEYLEDLSAGFIIYYGVPGQRVPDVLHNGTDVTGQVDLAGNPLPDLSAGFAYTLYPGVVYVGPDVSGGSSGGVYQGDLSAGFVIVNGVAVYEGPDVSGFKFHTGQALPDLSAGFTYRYANGRAFPDTRYDSTNNLTYYDIGGNEQTMNAGFKARYAGDKLIPDQKYIGPDQTNVANPNWDLHPEDNEQFVDLSAGLVYNYQGDVSGATLNAIGADGVGSLLNNPEAITTMEFLPLKRGDTMAFVFDVVVGKVASKVGAWSLPTMGAAVTRIAGDNPTNSNPAGDSTMAGGIASINVGGSVGSGTLTFTAPTKRRVALKVRLGTSGTTRFTVDASKVPQKAIALA